MKLIPFLTFLCCLVSSVLPGQDCTSSTFAKTIGSPLSREGGNAIAVDAERKEIYIAGYAKDSSLIIKMDQDGNHLWSKAFDAIPGKQERAAGIVFDSDGMLCMAGMTDDPAGGLVYLLRYDPLAEQILWANNYVSHSNNYGFGLIEMGPDGNYLMSNNPFDPQDAELLEIDRQTGAINPDFSKHYNLGSSETFYECTYHDGNVYGIGRFTQGSSTSKMRTVIARLNATNGTPDWIKLGHRPAEASARLYGSDIVIAQDHIYSTCHGDTDGNDVTNDQLFVNKFDLDGNLVWIKEYGLPGKADVSDELIATGDGLVIMGRNRGPSDVFLFKINHDGEVMWARNYDFGTNDNTFFNGGTSDQLVIMDDALYFTMHSETEGKRDLILVKTDREGLIDVVCSNVHTIEATVTTDTTAAYYAIEPIVFTFLPEIVPLSIALIPNSLEIEQTCAGGSDTVTTLNEVICSGDIYEGYDQAGTYIDTFDIDGNCDSIRVLHLRLVDCEALVSYDLNACTSYMSNGTNMDYSEFIPTYPASGSCAIVSATTVFRSPPQENKHSCTPGLDQSKAMCVSSLPGCNYMPGHNASVVFEITVNPEPGAVMQITGLQFFEKAPLSYDWINGETGPNNYPQRFGIRILKNGEEIFLQENIPTEAEWTLREFDFLTDSLFEINAPTLFRVELLPYCPVGNGAIESVWDLENISFHGGCILLPQAKPTISGHVTTVTGQPVAHTEIQFTNKADFSSYYSLSVNQDGYYTDNTWALGQQLKIRAHNNQNLLEGVNMADLLALKNHLLGHHLFTTFDQFIAADINRDGKLNSKDIIALRNALLGLNRTFPGNSSWRFGTWPQDITPDNLEAWNEVAFLEYLEPGETEVNFLGIKIGDIARGRQPNAHTENTQPVILEWVAVTDDMNSDQMIRIDVFTKNDILPEAIRLSLPLQNHYFAGLESSALNVNLEDYSIANGNQFNLIWLNDENITLLEGDKLFSLYLLPNNNPAPKRLFDLSNQTDANEFTIDHYTTPVLFNQRSTIFEPLTIASAITIDPNPFQQNLNISFNLSREAYTQLSVFDMTGQMIWNSDGMLAPGWQTFAVNTSDLAMPSGVYLCRLVCDGQDVIRKLIKQ